jgi:hypothetical protein
MGLYSNGLFVFLAIVLLYIVTSTAITMKQADKQTPVSLQRSSYCSLSSFIKYLLHSVQGKYEQGWCKFIPAACSPHPTYLSHRQKRTKKAKRNA